MKVLVARAIVLAEGEGLNDPPFYEDYDEISQEVYRDQAKFILEVMRENPSKNIIDALTTAVASGKSSEECWRATLDSAINADEEAPS